MKEDEVDVNVAMRERGRKPRHETTESILKTQNLKKIDKGGHAMCAVQESSYETDWYLDSLALHPLERASSESNQTGIRIFIVVTSRLLRQHGLRVVCV